MECDRWVEEGLLLSSGELDGERKRAYEQHAATCESCAAEIERYHENKRLYFTPENLEYPTTQSLDDRIHEACGKTPRPATSINIFTTVARRVAAAGLFLAVGIGGSLYFVYNIQQADHHKAEALRTNTPTQQLRQAEAQLASQEQHREEVRDSAAADSGAAKEPSATVVKRGGGDGSTGVVPVDLQGDR